MVNIYIGKTCPYCQFPIKQDSEVIVCRDCKIPHHRECWEQNGCCTTFGCGETTCRSMAGEATNRPLAHLRVVEEKVEKKRDLRKKELDSHTKENFSTGTNNFWEIVIIIVIFLLLIWVICF